MNFSWFRNAKIGTKLGLGFGALIVLSLIIGGVASLTGQTLGEEIAKLQESEEQLQTIERLREEIFAARADEKSFLLNYPIQGVEAAVETYVTAHQEHLDEARTLIATQRAIEAEEEAPDEETVESLAELEETLSAYRQAFAEMVALIQQRGYKDTGLEGEFRVAVQALEDSPIFQANPDMQVLLLQLRRHEKDWILRQELDDVAVVNEFGRQLSERIAALPGSAADRQQLQTLLDQYLAQFNTLVELDVTIAQSRGNLQTVVDPFEELASEIIAEEQEEAEEAAGEFAELQRLASTINIGLLIGALAAGVGLAIVLGRNIAQPIVQLTDVAQKAAGGDLDQQLHLQSEDEVGQLADAFNRMTRRLAGFIGGLEDQIQARTAELSLSIEVGQKASAIRELDELLPTILDYIRAQFNLYYTHVYFVDDLGQNLVIRYGTGEVGQKLMARRHNLPVGAGSIVGQVAATKQSIVVPDTEQSPIHKANELLPKTRSEIAVPLVVEGQVIGVLDMQSERVDTFTPENQTVFEAMATQLAISIDSAQQWATAQAAQQKSREALQQLTRESWVQDLSSRKQKPAFAYDLATVQQLQAPGPNGDGISVPVQIQNETIGKLSVKPPANRDLSTDEQALLGAVVHQLAQKAETLRLFEQTQKRAGREQIARRITDKIRASRTVEGALKTAAEELSQALGVARAVVDLKVEAGSEEGSDNQQPPNPAQPAEPVPTNTVAPNNATEVTEGEQA